MEEWKTSFKSARTASGLSQQKLSTLMHIPKRTIEAWEQGDRTPPEYVQILILEKLSSLPSGT